MTEGVGKTDGKELASYLVEEQTRLSFIQQMGGPLAFLEAQEKKVTRHWSKAVLLEAKRMLPLLSDALKSEDELDFGEPEEADVELDFGAAVGTSTAGACAPASRAIDPSSSSLAAQRSAMWDHALPPRHGSVAKTAASRAALRDTFRIASLRTAEWAAAAEAEARARDSSLAIRSSTRAPVRGRVLPVSQLAGGLRAAERRMRLFTLRPDRPPELEEPAGSRPIDRGGDSYVQTVEEMPVSSQYWQRALPAGDLVGWRVQVVYPHAVDGEEGEEGEELRWAEGFVIDFTRLGESGRAMVHIYFEDDDFDDQFTLPDLDVAFHTPGQVAKVARRCVTAACEALGLE